jgi:hypothetical protein
MDVNREVEQFAALDALVGRPILIDSAERCSELFHSGQRAGLTLKEVMLGLSVAHDLGSPTPDYGDLNRLIVYQKLCRLAAGYRKDPSDDSWMPKSAFKEKSPGVDPREFYRSGMDRFAPLIDEMYNDLYDKVDREFPGYLKPKGVPFSHPGIEFTLRCSVFSIVQRFRAAVEHVIKVHGAPMHIEDFPRACCGIISELMGDYLNSLEIGEFYYVSSMLDGASHAWVEIDGLVVDITADQFPDRPGIYVDKPDAWYLSWEEDSRHLATHCRSAFFYSEEHQFLNRVLDEVAVMICTGRASLDESVTQ